MDSVKNTINFPLKGLNKDTHESMISKDNATDLMNVRVFGSDGSNLIFVNINGSRDMFELSDGFYPIGIKGHDNILYVVSRNSSGVVEVGSYPSPKQVIKTTTYSNEGITYDKYDYDPYQIGVENVYKPFISLGHGNLRLGFRTAIFGYNEAIVSIICKKSFDGTMNLYLTNGENLNRVMNSFFNEDGYVSDRVKFLSYDVSLESSISSTTQQFLSIHTPPQGRLQEVSYGGELPCGNIFLYMRYLDYEYNATNFLPLEGPISIVHGSDPFTIHGANPEKLYDNSDKQMKVKVRYLDHAFHFMEIAMVRHTGNNANTTPKCLLVNKRMVVPDSDTIDIVITGKESMADISYEEIIRPVMRENVSLGQISLNNRWWGVSWKESSYNRDAMAALARRVYGVPGLINRGGMFNQDGSSMQDYKYYNKTSVPGNSRAWYQDAFQVLDNVGYFRGEIYPFAVVGLKDDGSFTEAFPITGYDNYVWGSSNGSGDPVAGYNTSNIEHEWLNGGSAVNPTIAKAYLDDTVNTNCGFIRMPQFGTGALTATGARIDDMNYQMFLEMRVSYAIEYMEQNQELFNNIKGFYVVRGDRLKNLICHGIMQGTYDHLELNHTNEGEHNLSSVFGVLSASNMSSASDMKIALSIPLSAQDYYHEFNTSPTGILRTVLNLDNWENAHNDNYLFRSYLYAKSSNNKRAIFSPDISFAKNSNIENNQDYYIYLPYTPNLEIKNNCSRWVNKSHSISESYSNYYSYPDGRMAADGFLLATTAAGANLIYKDNYNEASESGVFFRTVGNRLLHNYTNSEKKAFRNPYIKTTCVFVPEKTFSVPGKFSSKMQDIVLGERMNPGFMSWYTNGDKKNSIGNRDTRTTSYIGLDINPKEEWPNDFIYWKSITYPYLIYKTANTYYVASGEKTYYENIVDLYTVGVNNLSSIMYYINNQFVDFNRERTRLLKGTTDDVYVSIANNGLYLLGDCFITRYFFRMNYNGETYSFLDSEASNSYAQSYDFGSIVSIPLMSVINTCMRGIGDIGFYPSWAKDASSADTNDSILTYARFGGGINRTLGEDHIYDYGHSETQHHYFIPGIDESIHEHTLEYLNRVRYSDSHIAGSYVDGWRSMYYNSKQDFPSELGDIMSIAEFMDYCILICQNAIIQLRIDVKVQQADNVTGSEVLLGLGTIINPTFKKLADYGSQHSQIATGYNGVYGYDNKRNIFWSVALKAGTNSVYLAAESISDGVIASYLRKKKNMTGLLGNDMLSLERSGVLFGYDETNKEVLFTILHRKLTVIRVEDSGRIIIPNLNINDIDFPGFATIAINGSYDNVVITNVGDGYIEIDGRINDYAELLIEYGCTIVYSELLKSISQYSFTPSLYAFANDAVIMYNRLFCTTRGKIQSNDNSASRCQFWGFNDGFKVGVIVNDSKEGLDKFHKMMSSCVVTSDSIPFDKLEVYTEFQYAELFPFYNTAIFWVLPEYTENTWKINIPVQSSSSNTGYNTEAQMRGTWIKLLLKYMGTSPKYIGGIISKYILSFN